MTNENTPVQPEKPLTSAVPVEKKSIATLPKPEKRVFSFAEKLLLPIAIIIAILFDRLIMRNAFFYEAPFLSGIFWLSYLIIFYLFYWKRLKCNKALWIVAGFSALLCIWNFIFDYDSEYGGLTMLVIPAVLMAHAVYLCGAFTLKDAGKIAVEWLLGWLAKPFSGIGIFIGAIDAVTEDNDSSNVKKVLLALAISVAMLFVILPLLVGADMVFGYYFSKLIGDFEISSLILHTIVIIIAAALFYSFLWNIGLAPRKPAAENTRPRLELDTLVSGIVLGVVLLTYLLFCAVQFTYLFAGVGLPGDMTYSEYAREGFAQINVICGINLLIFGIYMQYAKKKTAMLAMIASLLALTAIMLVSGFVRLNLYISAYGLTWLRLLSMWFIIYIAVVLVLCAVRIVNVKMPLIGVCAVLLLGWYTSLGYANPNALVIKHNLRAHDYSIEWLEDDWYYLAYEISDDGLIALIESGVDLNNIADDLKPSGGKSFSSARADQLWAEINSEPRHTAAAR